MNIKKIAEDLRILADDLEKMMAVGKEEAEKPNEVKETVKAEKPEETKEAEKVEKPKETKPVHNLEEVRAALAEKSKAGFTAEVRETIIRFGGNKLSDVPPSKYDALFEAAKGIGGESDGSAQ